MIHLCNNCGITSEKDLGWVFCRKPGLAYYEKKFNEGKMTLIKLPFNREVSFCSESCLKRWMGEPKKP